MSDNSKYDTIIFLVGLAHNKGKKKDIDEFRKINVKTAEVLIKVLKNENKIPDKFIFFSTISIYGERYSLEQYGEDTEPKPISPYALTKLECENYLKMVLDTKNLWIIRPAPVYSKKYLNNIDRRTRIKNIYYKVGNGKFKLSLCNINNIHKYTIGNIYYNYFLTLICTVNNLCIYYPNIVFSNELKSVFKNFIEVMLVKNHNIIITNVIVKYDEIEVNTILKNIILQVLDYKTLLCDTNLKNLKQKLLYSGNISVNEIKNINKIINYNDIEKLNKKQIVHPDKFCDPITNALIEIPIMLPNNVIVDKCMIYRYLLNNKNNPFDRQYLNKEILDNYNKSATVLEEINNFNNELKLYKNKII